jgi:hypothetical protein
MFLSTKSVLLEGLTSNEEQSGQIKTSEFVENDFDIDFNFEMQDFDSCEKASQSNNPGKNNIQSCISDFGINSGDLVEGQYQPDAHALKNEQKKSKSKQIRWRKQDDKDLFCELIKMLRIHNLTIEKFLDITRSGINDSLNEILIEKVNWKGTSVALVERIFRLNQNEKYLSCRDFKQLRKLFYQQLRNQIVDWDYLLFQFPGRNMDFIKEVCKSFPRRESILEKTNTQSI